MGVPYVWFLGADRETGGDEVKDIRSGAQVGADADTWVCPVQDLHPAVTRAG